MRKFEQYQDRLSRLYGGTLAKNVTIQVTEDCNLSCSYCYQVCKSRKAMSFDTAKKFIDLVLSGEKGFREYLEDKDCNGYVFDLIGGEPFLEIELLDKICGYIIDKMIESRHKLLPFLRFSISSNGTVYFDERVQEFLRKYREFISLSITIDGNKELHDKCRLFPSGEGSYDIAIKAVEHYMANGGSMGSKMTICPENIDYLSNAVISLIEKGYDDVHLNCVYEDGWTIEHSRKIYNELKRLAGYMIANDTQTTVSMFNVDQYKPLDKNNNGNWCGGDGRMIAVDPSGDIFPCLRYMKSSLGNDRPPLVLGNVNDGILQTKKQCDINQCLKCITRRSQSTDECFDCPIASGCAWCTAYNYQITGDPNKRLTYICDMHKAISLANVYYWNKRGVPFKMHLDKESAVAIVGIDEYNKLKEIESD